jgi:hypothetical protein
MISVMPTFAYASPDRLYKVHFRELTVPKAQRISGLSLEVACAHILNVDGVPNDWGFQMVSAVSAVEKFQADAGHGASWLSDLKQLDGILTIAVPSDSASCLSIKGVLLTEDEDRQHRLPIRFSEIRLEKQPGNGR